VLVVDFSTNKNMNEEKTFRAILADDHPIIIKGLQACLERDGDIEVVATASNTLELAAALDSTPCDYVFTDIGMSGIDGESNSIAFLRRLSWQERRPRLIAITMISQSQMVAGLIQIGIDGVIDKRDGFDCARDAIRATRSGRCYLSPKAFESINHFPRGAPARAGVLSRREWEVFQLYASGLLIPEIAARFGRSSKTVATQKRSGMRKLGLESEAELVSFLSQVGLV
jgi:two-component system, NarL family, captular synthesis response regulator RcsB